MITDRDNPGEITDKDNLSEVFSNFQNLPFLFIGSGVSRRYMGTPGWEQLLEQYAEKVHPDNPLALKLFEEQVETGNWPKVTSAIEKAYNSQWLSENKYAGERDRYAQQVKDGASPFKLSLAEYFSKAEPLNEDKHLIDELSILKNVAKRSVAGVITTNYDLLTEQIFEAYETYIGQEQILFSETQGIAEVYKIHGCCKDPKSIVINDKDYEGFNDKNAYLAAKLLTVFVEHPIIFMGYSISDPNVQAILKAIAGCIGKERLEVLKHRLVFIEYSFESLEKAEVSTHSIDFGESNTLEMLRVLISDYKPLYAALLSQKYEYNPKLLRQLKRDIYQLISTNEPVDRFRIADIEDDAEIGQYEVLAGVGVLGGGDAGHNTPEAAELFKDILFDGGGFHIESLVEKALKPLLKGHSKSLPIYKYIAEYRKDVGKEPPCYKEYTVNSLDDFFSKTIQEKRGKNPINSIAELNRKSDTPEKKLELWPLLSNLEDSKDELRDFLKSYLNANPTVLELKEAPSKTNLRRLIKIYDWLEYEKDALNTSRESG